MQQLVLLMVSLLFGGEFSHQRENQPCNVMAMGAVGGNGGHDDTAALQRALDDPKCSEVLFPSHHTFSASALVVARSDVTVTLQPNATLAGLPSVFKASRPDCATEAGLEFNWQHWCALLQVTAAQNFTLRGTGGTIAPGGVGGAEPDFYSALHVRSTARVSLSGVRIYCTAWWWCTAMHNASNVLISSGLFVDGSHGRDGLDLVNCRNVLIEQSRIEGSDDALCFKTIGNDGLDRFPAKDVVVRSSSIGSTWCNALQFGSASEIDMTNFRFEDLDLTFARKAAISIISMDGANISRVAFNNIRIKGQNIATPLYIKVGNRAACEDGKGTCVYPGSIKDVNFTNVTAVRWGNVSNPKPGHSVSYTATIEGLNASHRGVGPVKIVNLTLTTPGGGTAAETYVDPPTSPSQYQPRYDGVRPSYALFVRYARDVTVVSSLVGVRDGAHDGRPAFVFDEVQNMQMADVMVVPGANANATAPCQIEARNSTGNWTGGGHLSSCTWRPQLPPPALA